MERVVWYKGHTEIKDFLLVVVKLFVTTDLYLLFPTERRGGGEEVERVI